MPSYCVQFASTRQIMATGHSPPHTTMKPRERLFLSSLLKILRPPVLIRSRIWSVIREGMPSGRVMCKTKKHADA